jgi:hypothetical protein
MSADSAALRSLGRNDEVSVPRNGDGPVFRAPWEAEAFALAVSLRERGLFTWTEWAATLGDEIKKAQVAGIPTRARLTTSIGWRRLSESSPKKAWSSAASWRAPATPGSAPARAHRMARRSRCGPRIFRTDALSWLLRRALTPQQRRDPQCMPNRWGKKSVSAGQ